MDMYQKRKERQENNNQESFPKVSINWYPGHMLKTKKQIIEDLKLINVVIEILDARIPKSSRNPDIDQIIKNKKRIVLLNKSDLAESSQNKKWIKHFNKKGVLAIETDSKLGKGMNEVIKVIEDITKEETEKAISKGLTKKTIRVMIVGVPNVGKSSLINKLCKKNKAEVGNRPGVTKQKQWIKISNNIELLDTPGVLWPKFEDENVGLNLSYTGAIKDELIEKTEVAFNLITYLWKNYKKNLIERYKLINSEVNEIEQYEEDSLILMDIIARKTGSIVSGGKIDYEKVSNIILNDFRTGKIGKITLEKINEE